MYTPSLCRNFHAIGCHPKQAVSWLPSFPQDYALPQVQVALQVDPISVSLTQHILQLLLDALTPPLAAAPPAPAAPAAATTPVAAGAASASQAAHPQASEPAAVWANGAAPGPATAPAAGTTAPSRTGGSAGQHSVTRIEIHDLAAEGFAGEAGSFLGRCVSTSMCTPLGISIGCWTRSSRLACHSRMLCSC